jgi:peroxiredoxin
MNDYSQLPDSLPIPEDDGESDHLLGMPIPDLALESTSSRHVSFSRLPAGRTIVYVYPMTGKPGVPLPDGWDEIPGARGCTPEACGFRDHFRELKNAGVENVFGLSTQTTDYQTEVAERLHLPFELLSDTSEAFGQALKLPKFEIQGMTLYKRLTIVIRNGRIEKVFYPVFPPDTHAQSVLEWIISSP